MDRNTGDPNDHVSIEVVFTLLVPGHQVNTAQILPYRRFTSLVHILSSYNAQQTAIKACTRAGWEGLSKGPKVDLVGAGSRNKQRVVSPNGL